MTSFRPDIQALRAVAVVLVVAFHVWPTHFRGGYVGVDVFFVISGYLITGHLVREVTATGRVDLPGFYARRARRLLPAASLTLVVVGLASYLWMPSWTWATTAADIAASTGYAENWMLVSRAVDYQAQNETPSPLQHFWSLAVEEQFYFGWPVLVAGVAWVWRKWGRGGDGRLSAVKGEAVAFTALHPSFLSPPLALEMEAMAPATPLPPPPPHRAWYALPMAAACAASFVTALFYAHARPEAGYFATHTRLYELGMGGLLAVFASGGARPSNNAGVTGDDTDGRSDDTTTATSATYWLRTAAAVIGLAAIGTSAALFTAHTAFPGVAALAPTLGAIGLLWAGEQDDDENTHALVPPMSHPWLQYIGDVSYSLYLAHWPVVIIYPFATGRAVEGVLADGVFVCIISMALAHACKRCWEDTFRAAGRRRLCLKQLHQDAIWVRLPAAGDDVTPSFSGPRVSTDTIAADINRVDIPGSSVSPPRGASWLACLASVRHWHLHEGIRVLFMILTMAGITLSASIALYTAAPAAARNVYTENAEVWSNVSNEASTTQVKIWTTALKAERRLDYDCDEFFGPNASYPYPGADAPLNKCRKINTLNVKKLASLGTASARIDGKFYPNPPAPGPVNLSSGRGHIIVLGDSHGGRWNAAFGVVGRRLGLNITNLFKSSCAPTLVRLQTQTQECLAWNVASVNKVLSMQPDVVIMVAYKRRIKEKWVVNETDAAIGLARVAQKIVSGGIPVLYIKSTPHMHRHVPDCLAQEAKRNPTAVDLSACSVSREEGISHGIMELAARRYPLMQRMSFDDVFCPGVTCPPVIGNVIVYTDAHHISPAFSKSLASALQQKLLEMTPHLFNV